MSSGAPKKLVRRFIEFPSKKLLFGRRDLEDIVVMISKGGRVGGEGASVEEIEISLVFSRTYRKC